MLFCCFTAIRYRPHVVTVLRSERQDIQGVSDGERQAEDACAFALLGVTHEALDTGDREPDWEYVRAMLKVIDDDLPPDRVFAPAAEQGGHEQHTTVAEIADEVFGVRVTHYLTYTNGRDRSRGVAVDCEPEWVGLKLCALACYRTQICLASTGHHFAQALHEWWQP